MATESNAGPTAARDLRGRAAQGEPVEETGATGARAAEALAILECHRAHTFAGAT